MKLLWNAGGGAMSRAAALIFTLGLFAIGCSVQSATEATSSTAEAFASTNSLWNVLAPGADGSVFWSGTLPDGTRVIDAADAWARSAGRSTLEGRLHDLNVDAPWTQTTDPTAEAARRDWWATVSQMYASLAVGNVFFFSGLNQRDNSTWNTIELPALRSNSNVRCIYSVDPVTFDETLIHGDPAICNRPKTTSEPEWFVRVAEDCRTWIESGPSHFTSPHASQPITTTCADAACTYNQLFGGEPESPGPAETFVYSLEPTYAMKKSTVQAFVDSHIRMFVTMEPTGIPRAEVVDGGNHHLGYLALYAASDVFDTPTECVVIPEPGP